MKRKKITRAYKIGYVDGVNRQYNNEFADGSLQSEDYKCGYQKGVKSWD